MSVTIRHATSVDATAIVALAETVWPDEPLDAATIECLIAESSRATLLAELNDTIVGFVDGFVTCAASGALRWEVDLLAVSPSAQGRGVGRRLVGESIKFGASAGAVHARALIRVGNIASERVFAVHGFVPERDESELWVAEGLIAGTNLESTHVVPVRTFRYAGRWLEESTPAALCSLRPSAGGGVTGAVIHVTDREAIDAAAAVGMQYGGRYHFWQRAYDISTI